MANRAAFIELKYSKNSNMWNITFKNNVLNVIYSCDGKVEFSASLLQSSVSHDPSSHSNWLTWFHIITFLINFEKSYLIFLWNVWILFNILWWTEQG